MQGRKEDKMFLYGRLCLLLDESLVPELLHDIDTHYIQDNYYDVFRTNSLDPQLSEIFALLSDQQHLLYKTESRAFDLRRLLILLLCEQTASGTIFQTKIKSYLNKLNGLVAKHFQRILHDDENVVDAVFDYYKGKLRRNHWKKEIGSIHGFQRFCQLHYELHGNQLNKDQCLFALSVAHLFEEHYQPSYKEMGFRLINTVLDATPEDILLDSNVHKVLYHILFRNIPKMFSVAGSFMLWRCLCKCIALMNPSDFSKWVEVDDVIEAVMRKISLEPDSSVCCYQFGILLQLGLDNATEIKDLVIIDDIQKFGADEVDFATLRQACKSQSFKVYYKWAKRLLELFLAESHLLLVEKGKAIQMLRAMHTCYIVCITTMPVKVCEPHLIPFLEKFILVLMEVIINFKKDSTIVQLVEEFLTTISLHLGEESYQQLMSEEASEMKINLEKLLKHSAFGKRPLQGETDSQPGNSEIPNCPNPAQLCI
ncbi:uncharacterized protein LOC119651609 [Hermetia illucens]|nr:uncharacterized protein LOC119651609 [Hermetia illucens]